LIRAAIATSTAVTAASTPRSVNSEMPTTLPPPRDGRATVAGCDVERELAEVRRRLADRQRPDGPDRRPLWSPSSTPVLPRSARFRFSQ
jgi:hypothetical protein